MKRTTTSIFITVLVSIVAITGVIYAASHNVTSTLGGSSGDFFDIDGTMIFDSIKVGDQGVGGVTFFNGTIINNTTGEGDSDIPVTFGDNVRIDGRVYRGATAGTGDDMPFIINDNLEIEGSLTVDGDSPYIQSLTAGDNVSLTDNEDGTWTIASTDTDTDTNTDTGIFTFFIAGELSSSYMLDGTYLNGWTPTSGTTLTLKKITVNAQTPPQGGDVVFSFSDDGGNSYDNLFLMEDNSSGWTSGFANCTTIDSENGFDIRYVSGPSSGPENVNVIIEYEIN